MARDRAGPALDAALLLALARESIRHGLDFRRPLAPPAAEGPLAVPGSCFVSLHLAGRLRGCIGDTDRARPLIESLLDNAYAAAFRDPRFPPLTGDELERLAIEVHVLGPLEPLAFADLPALYGLLRPGEDGLQLERAQRRGVFLPVMWKELPTPERFVAQLLRKARIDDTTGLAGSRFRTDVFSS